MKKSTKAKIKKVSRVPSSAKRLKKYEDGGKEVQGLKRNSNFDSFPGSNMPLAPKGDAITMNLKSEAVPANKQLKKIELPAGSANLSGQGAYAVTPAKVETPAKLDTPAKIEVTPKKVVTPKAKILPGGFTSESQKAAYIKNVKARMAKGATLDQLVKERVGTKAGLQALGVKDANKVTPKKDANKVTPKKDANKVTPKKDLPKPKIKSTRTYIQGGGANQQYIIKNKMSDGSVQTKVKSVPSVYYDTTESYGKKVKKALKDPKTTISYKVTPAPKKTESTQNKSKVKNPSIKGRKEEAGSSINTYLTSSKKSGLPIRKTADGFAVTRKTVSKKGDKTIIVESYDKKGKITKYARKYVPADPNKKTTYKEVKNEPGTKFSGFDNPGMRNIVYLSRLDKMFPGKTQDQIKKGLINKKDIFNALKIDENKKYTKKGLGVSRIAGLIMPEAALKVGQGVQSIKAIKDFFKKNPVKNLRKGGMLKITPTKPVKKTVARKVSKK